MVTEHQASIYRCAHCRGVTKAAFPEGVVSPAQYGERLKAAAIYLNIQQLILRGSDRAGAERSHRRAADLSGQHRRLGGKEGAGTAASLPTHRRARGRGEG